MLYEKLKSVRDYFPINLCPIQDDALTSQEQDDLELEEESMIIPHIRVHAWVWDVMCHFKQYLSKVLYLSYSCPEIY